ncbi:MAG: WYL domain-containing protein [Anaerolineaceae bacterium]|nr:WYL domain-containing protein [Anaerolineaceae bacterium]
MRADRLLGVVMLLQTRGKMTTQRLAKELGVSRRTILRDIDALSGAGIPVYSDGGHGGGVALDENYRVTLTGLKEAEIRSLFVANNNQLLKDVGLGAAAESSLLKLAAALPTAHQPSVDYIRQRIYIDPLWWWHDSEPLPFWDELQKAVYEDICIQTKYENYDGSINERILQPYSLVAKSSSWYLIAKREGELRTYRVSRFQDVKLLDDHFQRGTDFDLPGYWQEHLQEFTEALAEYEFKLRIHESRLSFVRWLTPGRVQVIEPVDATGWLTVHLHMASIELAKMLVFGLGKDALVLEPPELSQAVIEAAKAIIEQGRS